MRRAIASVVVLLLCGCAGWTQTSSAAPAKPDAAPLMQADRDFNRATQERRLEGWMDFMADNIVLGHEDQPNFGKDAVRKAMAFLDDASLTLTWEPTYGEMFASGDFGFTTGKWVRKGKDPQGVERMRTGRYLTVWKKQKDGGWKVVWDGGTPDPRA